MMKKTLLSVGFVTALTIVSACDSGGQVTPLTIAPTNGSTDLAAFAGTWTSSASAGLQGACSDVQYVVTPTGRSTATVTYSATCLGRAVTGSGSGNLNGSTLEWTTTGTAAPCAFSLTGTAIEVTNGIRVSYTGQVCGLPVAGTQVLRR